MFQTRGWTITWTWCSFSEKGQSTSQQHPAQANTRREKLNTRNIDFILVQYDNICSQKSVCINKTYEVVFLMILNPHVEICVAVGLRWRFCSKTKLNGHSKHK